MGGSTLQFENEQWNGNTQNVRKASAADQETLQSTPSQKIEIVENS